MNRYRPMRPQPKQPMTVAQSVTNLTMLVMCCTDKRLAEMTPAELVASYRVKPEQAARMLSDERTRREARNV